MSAIEVTRVADAGERCWGIRLLGDDGEVALESIEAVSKGVAHSMAKRLKHAQAGAPSVGDQTAVQPGSGAVAHTGNDNLTVKFALIEEATFRVFRRPGDDVASIGQFGAWFVDVEIRWSPPEEDPANRAKESDHTKTKGIPGS